MARKKTWNYDTWSDIRGYIGKSESGKVYKRKAAEKKRKEIYKEDYATERWDIAATPSTQMGDVEWQMELLKDPYARNNPFLLMGLDTGTQPSRVFYSPRGNVRNIKREPDTVAAYHRDQDAVTMYDSVFNKFTSTEDRHILIHEIMHRGFAKWEDIFKNNPEAYEVFRKFDRFKNYAGVNPSEKDKYMLNTLYEDKGGHPYIYPKGRYAEFPEKFRHMQSRESLRVAEREQYGPKHRGIEAHSGRIEKSFLPGVSYYTRPVPQSYLKAIDKYVIPYIIERYPSLANHPAFRRVDKKNKVKEIKKLKRNLPESWNY